MKSRRRSSLQSIPGDFLARITPVASSNGITIAFYERNPEDVAVNPAAAQSVASAARVKFGEAAVHYFSYKEKNRRLEFPVRFHDGRVVSCLLASDVLNHIPEVSVEFVFIAPKSRREAERWLAAERTKIIVPPQEDAE